MAELDLFQAKFYAILDTGYVSPADWKQKALALMEGGADLLQVRAKKESRQQRRTLAESVYPLCEDAKIPLIINDDLDLALSLPNAGLHLGQDDLPIEKAREVLGPDRILGLSTHSLDQAQAALSRQHLLNYFAVGPVFPTATKPDYIPVGLKLVRDVANLNPSLPWFCIGGISPGNVKEVKSAGGRRIVVVSAVLLSGDTSGSVAEYKQIFAV